MKNFTKPTSCKAQEKFVVFLLSFLLMTLISFQGFGQNWEGDVDSDWNDPLNWAGDSGPTGDVVIDPANYTNAPEIILAPSAWTIKKVTVLNGGTLLLANNLSIQDDFTVDGNDTSTPSVTMTGGTLDINGGTKKLDIKKGGIFNLSGGTINTKDFIMDGNGNILTAMNMSGGSIDIAGKVDIKNRAIFTITGGDLTSAGDITIEQASFFMTEDDGISSVNANGKLTVKCGNEANAKFIVAAGSFALADDLEINGDKGEGRYSAMVEVSGGSFTANATTAFKNKAGDVATFKVTGGTATFAGQVNGSNGTIDFEVSSGALIFQENLVMDDANDMMTQTGGTIQFEGGDKDWTLNGTFISTGGNVTFNDATNTDLTGTGTFNFFDVIINSGKIVTQAPANINVAGDWTNSGGTFNEGLNKVTFNGSKNQTITNTSVETFYGFALDKSAGTLTLDDNVIIDNTLTMTQGQLSTGSNRLTLGTGAGVGEGGTLTYTGGQISGEFERWIETLLTGTDFFFPTGNGSETGMTLNFTNLTGGSLIAEFFNTDPGDNSMTWLLTEASLDIEPQFPEGYWQVPQLTYWQALIMMYA